MRIAVALLVGVLLTSTPLKAWVYPEHRDIAVLAVLERTVRLAKRLNARKQTPQSPRKRSRSAGK